MDIDNVEPVQVHQMAELTGMHNILLKFIQISRNNLDSLRDRLFKIFILLLFFFFIEPAIRKHPVFLLISFHHRDFFSNLQKHFWSYCTIYWCDFREQLVYLCDDELSIELCEFHTRWVLNYRFAYFSFFAQYLKILWIVIKILLLLIHLADTCKKSDKTFKLSHASHGHEKHLG